MTAKSILTIGFELADDHSRDAAFRSRASLLDWDIVLFQPDILGFVGAFAETYQGKPSLEDTESFQARECCAHWRREIKQAVQAGKTIVVFLPEPSEVFVDTGERSYSGTGRNQKTTRHVELLTNYSAIPATLEPVAASGQTMKLAPKNAEVLGAYWSSYESVSYYSVILEGAKVPELVLTRVGDKPVGAIYRDDASSGTLLLLPNIDFYPDSFLTNSEEGQSWTQPAEQFAHGFVNTIVSLDKALRGTSEKTPEPDWAMDSKYMLSSEKRIRSELLDAERAVESAHKRREELREDLVNAVSLRDLLFEKGKPLEKSVIDALRILGFEAESFKDSDSEFDVVFATQGGRLIGEAEGKDNKAIGVDKLRQLSMNIHEDLQRDTVEAPAKAVLFGNPFRLSTPLDRKAPFTEKCMRAAESTSTALVSTPDLFAVAQYLVENSDPHFAEMSRKALLSTNGRVVFPDPPLNEAPSDEVGSDGDNDV